MAAWLDRLNPFKTPDARRLALLFGVVYFAQGMWSLPNQTTTICLVGALHVVFRSFRSRSCFTAS